MSSNFVKNVHLTKFSRNQITLLGRNTVLDTLKSDKTIIKVVISSDVARDERIDEIVDLSHKRSVPCSFINPGKFAYFYECGSSQGVAAFMEAPQKASIEQIIRTQENPVFLLFTRLDYEQNLGAVMRTAWAANVAAVICAPNGVSQITPAVSKVSQGGVAYVPLIRKSLFQTIDVLKRHQVPVVGVEVGKGEVYYKQNLLGPVAFVFGGESAGISEPLMRECDLFIHIPINHELASLNVSVAAALIVFEKLRQEKTMR